MKTSKSLFPARRSKPQSSSVASAAEAARTGPVPLSAEQTQQVSGGASRTPAHIYVIDDQKSPKGGW